MVRRGRVIADKNISGDAIDTEIQRMPDGSREVEGKVDDKHATRVDGKELIGGVYTNARVANLGVKRQHRACGDNRLRRAMCPRATTGMEPLTA